MKAAVLSAAFAGAIPALAGAPPAYEHDAPAYHHGHPHGSAWSVSSSTVSSSTASAPYGYGHGNSTSSWGATGTWAHHSSSTPVAPVSYSSSTPVDVTVTKYETVYASVCSADDSPSTYKTDAVTETHTYTYTEDVLTSTTGFSDGKTYTSTYHITKTVTKTETATVYPSTTDGAKPTGYGSESAPVDPATESATWTGSAPVYGSITLTYATPDVPTTAPSYETSLVSKHTTPCTETYTTTYGDGKTSVVTTSYMSTVTSAYTKPHSGYPYPSGSFYPSSGYANPSGYYPGGNGTHVGPTGTGMMTGTTTTTTSSTACSTPTQAPECIPCEGQSGPDEPWCGLDINTNYYNEIPNTCRTVEMDLEISNVTFSPDGFERLGLVINGQMPGPLIEANWGDTIVIHLTNSMQNNGTSLHFHGIRQNYTNEMDGVPSITQCALAPGESMTYTFRASNYGTSWYHSHFALQTYDGVFGPLIIHGPHSAEFDEDVGAVMLQDWSHIPVEQMYDAAQTVGPAPRNGPRTLDTGLINGLNVFGADESQTGGRFEMWVTPGKKYLLRVVNGAIQTTFKFHLDGHKFTVISTDFVPIVPYETDILNINIGQRYNIIFEADQVPGDYWLRSDAQQACSTLTNSRDIKGIVHYEDFFGTPTTESRTYTDECRDESYASLVPVVPIAAGAVDDTIHETVLIGPGPQTPNLFKWTLDGTTFQSQWGHPTLEAIYENGTVPDYSGNLAIEIPNLKEWVYIIIESPIPLPHPIHLHGHDFLVVAQGTGPYIQATAVTNTVNPPRRDVAMMPYRAAGPSGPPAGGYLVLAFETDNPGAWLMHCHIGWHSSMGFALQIIENLEGIKPTVKDSCQLEGTCKTWREYEERTKLTYHDSGI